MTRVIRQVLAKFEREETILLGFKIWKKFNEKGMWNFPGGTIETIVENGVERPESPKEVFLREIPEEVGCTPRTYVHEGKIQFYWLEEDQLNEVDLFTVLTWDGEPHIPVSQKEPEFLKLQWHPKYDLPYAVMFDADAHWVPDWVAGKPLQSVFYYNNKREAKIVESPKHS